jgi:hypothetical protein
MEVFHGPVSIWTIGGWIYYFRPCRELKSYWAAETACSPLRCAKEPRRNARSQRPGPKQRWTVEKPCTGRPASVSCHRSLVWPPHVDRFSRVDVLSEFLRDERLQALIVVGDGRLGCIGAPGYGSGGESGNDGVRDNLGCHFNGCNCARDKTGWRENLRSITEVTVLGLLREPQPKAPTGEVLAGLGPSRRTDSTRWVLVHPPWHGRIFAGRPPPRVTG